MNTDNINKIKNKSKDKNELSTCENNLSKLYSKKCGTTNKQLLENEEENREMLEDTVNDNAFLYPTLDDPNFNIKISQKKEFSDTRYDGDIYDVEAYAKVLKTADYELLPQQAFVKNFLSFQTPYNSLLLFHGLGSGKTCSAIGVCEEMRDYLKQMGINKRIIIVASPNVQDNFRLQLFDERKLKEVDGIWTMKGCLGNKLLKEINPTGMKGLKREKIIDHVKKLINDSYSFKGYVQFSNEIVRNSGNPNDKIDVKIKNLENEYSDRLVVIDEVHNIRISDDNENKNVAKNLMFLVSVVSNLRLLLLSATPMFNSYKEIVWLINLMNMNDRRGIVSVSDIFDKNGDWKRDKDGYEIGKELLMRKVTGYVSYVRGENPYTFPFRVYPDRFAINNTFKTIDEYPKYQINGRKIPDDRKISKLSLYIDVIGEYQEMGYNYIMNSLRSRQERTVTTRKGIKRKMSAFEALKSFGYTDLQYPIEALNIIYPYDGLEELVKEIKVFEINNESEQDIDDISPVTSVTKEVVEEIDEVISNGPQLSPHSHEPSNLSRDEADISHGDTVSSRTDSQTDKLSDNAQTDKLSKSSSKTSNSNKSSNLSFKASLQKKLPGEHIVEGETVSDKPDISQVERRTDISKSSSSKLGGSSKHIDPKELTGALGLKRIMDYIDTKTPAVKGQFEYKKNTSHIFKQNEIGKYSSKIKTICNAIYNSEKNIVSDGIILIYSSYIDAGIIPMALALEEMGFTRYGEKSKPLFKSPPTPVVDVRTMKPPQSKKDFKPARYVMITGDGRISPNNDGDVKAITDNSNIFSEDEKGNIIDISGQNIKVVLISQAGSEGLDFKGIRQVHILDPWYNVNRLEQIIGRAVRNFSHKDLPFSKRNVQIYLHGTLLSNTDEEAADLYVYRISEIKAVKIGKVTRLLKQTSADCIINHDQTELIAKNFNKIEANRNITQELSDHQILKHFEVGDVDNSATCDFMKCEFKCLPEIDTTNIKENTDTYNEPFMLINSDKIIQKIKALMKLKHYYKKNELLDLINTPKKYPKEQIFAGLTQVINDNAEYIIDKYGRTGYLINIGEYYLFQPSELNNKNISIHDRSIPIDYKHDMIRFQIKSNISKPVIDKRNLFIEEDQGEIAEFVEGRNILLEMMANYKLVFEKEKSSRGNQNWYELCGIVMRKMSKEDDISPNKTEQEKLELLEQFLIEHIVDSLLPNDRIELLNLIYSNKNASLDKIINENPDEKMKRFYEKMKTYLTSKFITTKGLTALVTFNGPSRKDNLTIYVLDKDTNKWNLAEPEDNKLLQPAMLLKYRLKTNLNNYVGFIGFEKNNKYMVYKVKDTLNKRTTGFRCDQNGKQSVLKVLNSIEDNKRFDNSSKETLHELCVRQELTLRLLEATRSQIDKKTYFLDTETAIINEFEKKEK